MNLDSVKTENKNNGWSCSGYGTTAGQRGRECTWSTADCGALGKKVSIAVNEPAQLSEEEQPCAW